MSAEEGERGRSAPGRRSFVLVPLPVSTARGADGDVRARRQGGACGTDGAWGGAGVGRGRGLRDPGGRGTPSEAGLGPHADADGRIWVDAAGADQGACFLRPVLQTFKH